MSIFCFESGRDKEINNVSIIICKRTGFNPINVIHYGWLSPTRMLPQLCVQAIICKQENVATTFLVTGL